MRLDAIDLLLSAIMGVALWGVVSCAPRPWLAQRVGCEELDHLAPAVVARCTEAGFEHRTCLVEYGEPGIACVSQLERKACDGPWKEVAHQCGIYLPPREE